MVPLRSFWNKAVAFAVISTRSKTYSSSVFVAAFSSSSTMEMDGLFPFLATKSSSSSVSSERIVFHHVEKTESTQDVARQLLAENLQQQQQQQQENQDDNNVNEKEDTLMYVVTATHQTRGRGTNGRQWIGIPGNVFMTVAVPMDTIPVTITLLPLQIGVLVAERIDKIYRHFQATTTDDTSSPTAATTTTTTTSRVRVKWPNDVLLGDDKIAGVLIESFYDRAVSSQTWLLVGIGVNLVQAPSVPSEGSNRGRPATCLQQHTAQRFPKSLSQLFAQDLAVAMEQWITLPSSSSQQVRDKWKQWAAMKDDQEVGYYTIRDTNEQVTPIDLKPDGQLLVLDANGQQRLLVADYLY